jgi:DNA polymerase III subunit gamma/tau
MEVRMIVKRGEGDFSQIYRPCRISEMVGNDRVKKIIQQALEKKEIPHAFLFHGVSGTGKTTIARIIELGLNCEKGPTSEPCCECQKCKLILQRDQYVPVREINAVDITKERIREYLKTMTDYGFGLFNSSKRDLLLVDECHGLTEDQAGLFLNYVEDAYENMFFIFCTTKPEKVLDTLKNRCVINVKFDRVPDKEILRLLMEICGQENLRPDKKVLSRIVKAADGMPRNAVNGLQESALAGDFGKISAPEVEKLPSGEIVQAIDLQARISDCKDVVELKDLQAKAEALRVYLRKAGKNLTRQNQAAAVKIRAERRCGEILAMEIEQGGDRRSESRFDRRTLKELGITKYQSHCWQTIAKWPKDLFEAHIAKVKDTNKELTSKAIYRSACGFQQELKGKDKPIPGEEFIKTPIRIKLINNDFMECIDRFENIDAIITDPPYGKQDLDLYAQLAEFSAKVLKPGGSLLAMAGVYYLPQVLELMTPHLNYHWTIAYQMPSKHRPEWNRKVLNSWKPILWFVKGDYSGRWNKDFLQGSGIEKALHPWQQPEEDFGNLIEMVTNPDDVILDPFFGTGTLGAAAIKLNRKFVGIDIDSVALETAEARLKRIAYQIVLPSHFPGQDIPKIMENWEKQKNDSGDSDEIKANPTDRLEEQKAVLAEPFEENETEYIPTDRTGVYTIKLKERKSDQPKEPAASDTVESENEPEKAKIISSKSKKRKPSRLKKTGSVTAVGRKKAVKRKR